MKWLDRIIWAIVLALLALFAIGLLGCARSPALVQPTVPAMLAEDVDVDAYIPVEGGIVRKRVRLLMGGIYVIDAEGWRQYMLWWKLLKRPGERPGE